MPARYAGLAVGAGSGGSGGGAGQGSAREISVGAPPNTYTGLPRCTSVGKYSEMCISDR
jgi:hypothetical protein